jgi:hypothetical protein
MTPGQLVKAVSIALDVPEETVVQHDRNLVVAGLRTTGARGINAPPVTYQDAARLFVATFASIRTKDSVGAVRAFEKTKFSAPLSSAEILARFKDRRGMVPKDLEHEVHNTEKFADVAIMSLPPQHNFVDAIASLIRDASDPVGDLEQYLKRFALMHIHAELPWVRATIGHYDYGGSRANYERPPQPSSSKTARDDLPLHFALSERYGITQQREAKGTALMLLGRAFREKGINSASTKEALSDLHSQLAGRSAGKQARGA